ncbi:galactose-3-O-sulfotransferase 2-like isoform X2 [Dreissena polymorpha]|uniref:Uncharacterized protein n=1 Tax=Dreissena polymorpha TaxID=45954 RepID=A0A9D4M9U9_DREPO|nr:galactose-3-O-sulfotransferase 2-like isoform X2 [Dreissena polymorpha]KAH3872389.1 hypothetical protein DPMN_035605 [Dreissena polymorpha]
MTKKLCIIRKKSKIMVCFCLGVGILFMTISLRDFINTHGNRIRMTTGRFAGNLKYGRSESRLPMPSDEFLQTMRNISRSKMAPINQALANWTGPVTHVGFLKVHKAASTTVQSIFLRFGWSRTLLFVLPPEFNRFGYPNIISLNESVTPFNTIPPLPGTHFDILCHHVMFGHQQWATVLPRTSVYIGTIREPFSHFKSVLNYFQPKAIIRLEAISGDPVMEFLKNPLMYDTRYTRFSFLNNRQSLEYGVPPEIIEKRNFNAFFDYIINVLDKQFALVILASKMDEGLVLMKRKLNWGLKEILYSMKNVRSGRKVDRFPPLTEAHASLHRRFATFDYLLYEFFEFKFNKLVEMEGVSFNDDVRYFKEIRLKVERFCPFGALTQNALVVKESTLNKEFEVTRDDCELMHLNEIPFTQMIREFQMGSATWPQKPRR